ncbi:hypothetical protein KSS93_15175 [Pseudomonas xanthosomatis]|uniref:hypothetical protein n=1 Tax=Pseudomonas xanthosomatis TaxID=2842356 RepID=UPI001C3D5083|nr:hypothetical protein [Pseudomonas xanthosomatis]QXH44238.1 hypothetical protein KSS93_15175 [Pseudomonas xanthosomatis]
MFNVMGEVDTPARYRSTTWVCFFMVLLLIAAAVAAPLYSIFGEWMAEGESRGIWIQRSGAVTTLFSFIAGGMIVFTSGRLHTPGFFGDSNRVPILMEFRWRFHLAETAIFMLSILGTVTWGYGDLIYRWVLVL